MSKEIEAYKIDKADAKVYQVITSKALPSINRNLQKPSLTGIDQSKLITKMVVMEGSLNDLKERTRIKKPIRKTFPYYDELVNLGVKPEIIENDFYNISDNKPYDRDVLNNPSLLYMPKNLPKRFNNPIAGITNTIIILNIMGAPMPREVDNPELQDVIRKMLKQHEIGVTLKRFIEDSGADFEAPKFDNVKTRIKQDLDAKRTHFFFFGAKILGVLEEQTLDNCAFNMCENLHQGIASLLAEPVLEAVLTEMKIPPLDMLGLMHEFKRKTKHDVAEARKAIGLNDLKNVPIENERANEYKTVASLYFNSQIPLFTAMG